MSKYHRVFSLSPSQCCFAMLIVFFFWRPSFFLFASFPVHALSRTLSMCVAESISLPSFHPFHVHRETAKRAHWYSEPSALRVHWLFMLWHLEAQGVDANIYLSFLIFNYAPFLLATAGSFLLPSYIWPALQMIANGGVFRWFHQDFIFIHLFIWLLQDINIR